MNAKIKVTGPLFNNPESSVKKALYKTYKDIANDLPSELKAVTPIRTGNMSKNWLVTPSGSYITIENKMKYSGWVYKKNNKLKTKLEDINIELAEVMNKNIHKALGG